MTGETMAQNDIRLQREAIRTSVGAAQGWVYYCPEARAIGGVGSTEAEAEADARECCETLDGYDLREASAAVVAYVREHGGIGVPLADGDAQVLRLAAEAAEDSEPAADYHCTRLDTERDHEGRVHLVAYGHATGGCDAAGCAGSELRLGRVGAVESDGEREWAEVEGDTVELPFGTAARLASLNSQQ